MQQTTNLNLKKPDYADAPDIQDINDNMDILDTEIPKKVDKVTGKGLSTEDYTTTEKNKLGDIQSGAQVNRDISDSVSSTSTLTVASSKAAKIAYDKGNDAYGKVTSASYIADKVKVNGVEDGTKIYDRLGLWVYSPKRITLKTNNISFDDPRGLAWDGTNFWGSDYHDSKIYKMNTEGTILSSIDSGSYPTGLTWDGSYLWSVALFNKIRKLNSSGTVLTSFNAPDDKPQGITWDGANFWVADEDTDKIYKLNTSGTVISSFDTGLSWLRGVTWDGVYIWCVSNYNDTINQFTTDGVKVASFGSSSSAPTGLTWDGAYLWDLDDVDSMHKFSAYAYSFLAK